MPEEETADTVEYPSEPTALPDAQVEISMMLKTDDYVMEDWAVIDELFRETGISCVITTIRPERYSETVNLNLSSGIVYDIMELAPEYAEAADEYIIDVTSLINEYAPNYVTWLNSFSSEMLTSLVTSTGEIKIFPFRQETGVIQSVPFITSEVEGRSFDSSSLYTAITSSGGTFAVPGSTTTLCELMASFFNTSTDAYYKDGELVYGPTTDEFKQMLLYLNSLYQNDMISESFFVYTETNFLYDIQSGDVTVGIFTEDFYEEAYEAGMEPFMFSPVDGAHLMGYANEPSSYAAISDANGNAIYAIQFIDYCFSDAGRSLLNNGIEELHVMEFDNGVMTALDPYTRYDSYQWEEQGLTPEGLPGVYYNNWTKFSEELYDLLVPMRQYAASEDFTVVALPVTGSDAIKSQVILGELNPLFHDWWTEFIVGSKSLSSDWDDYVDDIIDAGVNTYLKLHYD